MFWLVTGKPGTGKTSHTLDFVLHDKRFCVDGSDTRRPVFYRGIRDLKVDWTELTDDQVKNWPDHLPHGAVLVVDEAQQIWPGRAPSKPVPPGLTALETHRHQGWDIIFISQDPSLLDTHARKLCNEQFHYSRPFGAPFVIEYHSGSGYVNPGNKTELSGCVQRKKGLPKRVWDLYHSAEVHTHKFKPPKIIYALIAGIALAAFLLWRFTQNYGATTDDNYMTGQSGQSHQVARSPVSNAVYHRPWAELLQPEVSGLPYTAPIYDAYARQPTAIPVVHGCMSMETDYSDCTCYTQQGTTITDMPWQMCRKILKNGIFNHLARNDESQTGRRRGADNEARVTAPVAAREVTGLTL